MPSVSPLADSLCFSELEGGGIYAVAQSCGLWPVLKDVAEVGIAPAAHRLHSPHGEAVVHFGLDALLGARGPEAWPPGAGVELGVRTEQVAAAADALIDSFSLG